MAAGTKYNESCWVYSHDSGHLFKLYFDLYTDEKGNRYYKDMRIGVRRSGRKLKFIGWKETIEECKKAKKGFDVYYEDSMNSIIFEDCWLWDMKYDIVPPREQCAEIIAEALMHPNTKARMYRAIPVSTKQQRENAKESRLALALE